MIALEPHAEGVILPVKAHAGARRNEILFGAHAGMLQVSVSTAPEKGQANKAIIALLAEKLALRKADIELISGSTNAHKRFLVRGVSLDELNQKFNSLLE